MKDNKNYKGYGMTQGYPSRFALKCWMAEKVGQVTIYAKTLKELKEKVDTFTI